MSLRIYNTLARDVQPFVPLEPNHVRMYVCGMTIYDLCHIGHARMMIAFDVMQKWLRASGYRVTYVRNITDIDDKIIKRALERGIPIRQLTDEMIAAMHKDFAPLGIDRPTHEPRATEYVPQMAVLIQRLQQKGLAYKVEQGDSAGDYMYSVRKFAGYGKLSGKSLDDLRAGERVDVDQAKHDPLDFVLWKHAKEGEPSWTSPWGNGRPGWHIECSCISYKHCGEYLDIHCGGIDNAFPHHTNEIAQSEAFLGHKWCPYWFHVLHLNDARGKMSKSKGGFLTVSLLEEKGYNPLVYRMFCLQSHYRKPLTFSYDNLDNTATAYNKLVKRISALSRDGEPDMAKAEELTKGFSEALDNDLNTSLALTCVYDVLKADADDATKLYVIGEFDKVLSLDLTKIPESNKADADDDFAKEVEELIAQRTKARAEKDWATADAIRDKLKEMKVVVKDTKDGIEWHVEG